MINEQIVAIYVPFTLAIILLVVALLLLNKRMNDISNSNKILKHKVRDFERELQRLSSNNDSLLGKQSEIRCKINSIDVAINTLKSKIDDKADRANEYKLVIVTKDMKVHTRYASDLDKSIDWCIFNVEFKKIETLRTNKGDFNCDDIIAITKSIK